MCKHEGFVSADHTADLALRIWAADLEGVYRQAALGLGDLLADGTEVRPSLERAVEVRGIDREELLVAWLNEILYFFESEGILLSRIDTLILHHEGAEYRLEASITGEKRDPERHGRPAAVKAATYHNLDLEPDARGTYELTIVLDT